MSERPLVTVGLPVYNGEAYLAEAIDSILSQTYDHIEVVISDNGSSDGTEEICRDYARRDRRVRYWRHETNLGAAANYNHVFRAASGKYFKWASHDDLCAPEFIERCVEVLEDDPAVVLCYPSTMFIDENGKEIGEHTTDIDVTERSPHERLSAWLFDKRRTGWCNALCGVLRTDVLRRTGLIGNYNSSDVILLGELALWGKLQRIPDVMFFRRDHPDRTSRKIWSAEGRNAWFDPKRKGKPALSRWNWLGGYMRAVKRSQIGLSEKLYCGALVARWGYRLKRTLASELVIAGKRTVGRHHHDAHGNSGGAA